MSLNQILRDPNFLLACKILKFVKETIVDGRRWIFCLYRAGVDHGIHIESYKGLIQVRVDFNVLKLLVLYHCLIYVVLLLDSFNDHTIVLEVSKR